VRNSKILEMFGRSTSCTLENCHGRGNMSNHPPPNKPMGKIHEQVIYRKENWKDKRK
jgi:hypothetical protein